MRRCLAILVLSLLGACTIPQTVANLDSESPPAELGRSSWVRYSARAGGWLGAVAGGVVSVVFLPITYPISLIYDEPLGMARSEFLWGGVSAGASTGHFLLGAPTDFVDYAFYRAWADSPRPTDYEYTPQKPPTGPETTSPKVELKLVDPDPNLVSPNSKSEPEKG